MNGESMWLLYAIIAAILWGLSYSLTERIFKDNITLYTLLSIQMIFGGIFFFLFSYFTTIKQDFNLILSKPNLMYIFIADVFVALLGNYFISLSIQAKNATLAGLIEQAYPLFTLLFTLILFKVNHFNLSVAIGGILIFSGVLVISYFS